MGCVYNLFNKGAYQRRGYTASGDHLMSSSYLIGRWTVPLQSGEYNPLRFQPSCLKSRHPHLRSVTLTHHQCDENHTQLCFQAYSTCGSKMKVPKKKLRVSLKFYTSFVMTLHSKFHFLITLVFEGGKYTSLLHFKVASFSYSSCLWRKHKTTAWMCNLWSRQGNGFLRVDLYDFTAFHCDIAANLISAVNAKWFTDRPILCRWGSWMSVQGGGSILKLERRPQRGLSLHFIYSN